MTSKYTNIYSLFMQEIRDYEFANLQEPDITEQMCSWLRKSLSKPCIRRIFATLSRDDEIAEMEYTLVSPVDDDTDQDFVEELLSYQMVVEWLDPKVKTTTLLNQMITNSKESKFYAQQSHLAQLRELYADTENKVRGMLRDRGYIWNSYLGNTT